MTIWSIHPLGRRCPCPTAPTPSLGHYGAIGVPSLPFSFLKLDCVRWSQHVLYLHAVVQAYTDEDGAPATLPEMGNAGEESKLKVLLGLLRK